uniref:Ig-like domain-containing protein n=1 Tax=Junco hyemalis TaxID=40217 RepID=A0A8C5JQD5_JUNHY
MDDECILLGFAQTNNPLESTFLEMNIQARILAQAGSRVNLTCCYPCKYYSYEKYWCRWSNTGCAMLPVQQQQGLPQPGDACEPNARTVVLSLDPVTEEDKGWYWCGVKRNGVFGETMAVELRVSGGELRAGLAVPAGPCAERALGWLSLCREGSRPAVPVPRGLWAGCPCAERALGWLSLCRGLSAG